MASYYNICCYFYHSPKHVETSRWSMKCHQMNVAPQKMNHQLMKRMEETIWNANFW